MRSLIKEIYNHYFNHQEEHTLLPCWCGEEKVQVGEFISPRDRKSRYRVVCRSCGLSTREFPLQEEASEAWNFRPGDVGFLLELLHHAGRDYLLTPFAFRLYGKVSTRHRREETVGMGMKKVLQAVKASLSKDLEK